MADAEPRHLREAFARCDYTEEAIRSLLGPRRLGRGADRDVQLRRLGEGRLETLVKLFYLGTGVDIVAAEKALAPFPTAALESLGLVDIHGDQVRPHATIAPHDGLLIASDLDLDSKNQVPGIAASPLVLAWLTVRLPVDRALDLGTGGGIQAFLAARHARNVVAVDINPRALAYADLNARLNDVQNVEWRQGSWFEPIDGMRFDLIVSNPPFVVSPESAFHYRDSGRPPNELVQELLAAAPDHLNEGGYAFVMCDSAQAQDEGWRQPLERAIEGRGCDAWLLCFLTRDAVDYAAEWNLHLRSGEAERFREIVDRWVSWYSEVGVERISTVLVALRRRSKRPNWFNAIELPALPSAPANAHVLRLFEAQDEVRNGDPFARPLRPAPGARMRRRLDFDRGRFETAGTTLARMPGLPFAARLDEETAGLVERLDGRLVVRDPRLRRLYQLGLLEGR